MTDIESPVRTQTRVQYFLLWLGLFYTVWLTLIVAGGHLWWSRSQGLDCCLDALQPRLRLDLLVMSGDA